MEVYYQTWELHFGWSWTSEGTIVAETYDFFKVRTGWCSYKWVRKDKCQEITPLPKT